jgi:CMP-N-acetylneuraminic acid synthetase
VSRVAIIPARGGSKRLPRKNIIDFLGKPIIAYTVEAALQSKLFERVVVSTEDPEIAGVAKQYGAEIVKRSNELASDTATLREVCLDFLGQEAAQGRTYQTFACLLATAPTRTVQDICAVAELIEQEVCDFAMAVTNYDLPPHQALRKSIAGTLEPMWPDIVNMRSQDVPDLWVDNGSTYFADIAAFKQERTFYGSSLRGHSMPRERSIDIDDETDLEIALFWAKKLGL